MAPLEYSRLNQDFRFGEGKTGGGGAGGDF